MFGWAVWLTLANRMAAGVATQRPEMYMDGSLALYTPPILH